MFSTINGQLLLSMLAESIVDNIPKTEVLQINTDGITVRILREYRSLYEELCQKWEYLTKLELEHVEYSKMIIRDVNNYLAETVSGEVKPKGCFEIIPTQNGAVGYNKNWSMRVVPKAIHAYYLDGTPIAEYITNHDNIYDFCMGFRARKDWSIYFTYMDGNIKKHEKQQKTIRYYLSKSGGTLTKENKDGRVISLEAGKTCTMFNRFENKVNWDNYHIDYGYYIKQAEKIRCAVFDGQLKMF